MSPRRVVLVLFLVGLGLLVIGAALFFHQWPHAGTEWVGMRAGEVTTYTGEFGVQGNLRLSLAGAAIAGAGFLVILVPIIAWGVWLGQRLGESADG